MVWFPVPLKHGSVVCLFSIFIIGTSAPTLTKQEYKCLVKLPSILLFLDRLPFTLTSCLN